MTNLSEVLHLYLGCEIMIEETVCKIINVSEQGACFATGVMKDGKILNSHGGVYKKKIILRRLEDATDDECINLVDILFPNDVDKRSIDDLYFKKDYGGKMIQRYGEGITMWGAFKIVPYLLSRHFDLFGLIENGQAIDAASLKK